MVNLLSRLIGLSMVLVLVGCGPAVSRSDLGTVVFELPKIEGSDEPYPLPELGPRLENNKLKRHFPGF